MVYNRFVEIGRVAYVAFGPDEGKLVAIVDVVDQNKALVDGPASGVGRKVMSFKQLHLTKFVVNIAHSARSGTVRKAWEKAEVDKKWQESTWAKKIASKLRKSQLTDYERFKLMKAKQMRNRIINTQFGKLRKAAKVAAKKPIKKKHVNKKRHTAPVKI